MSNRSLEGSTAGNKSNMWNADQRRHAVGSSFVCPYPSALRPRGTMERLFVVRSNGETEKHIVSRGLYTNQASSDTSAYQALYGRISVNGDKFIIHPDSLVTLDTFHGPDDRSVWRSFGGYPADSTQHQIRGDDLHLEYYTYPADAPVLTRTVLYRIR